MLKVGHACDPVFQVPQLFGQVPVQTAGIGDTTHLRHLQLGGWAELAATRPAEEKRRPPVAESNTARRERGAEKMFSLQVSLLSGINKANPTFSLCCSIILTLPFSKGRMMDDGEGRKELRIFLISAFMHCHPSLASPPALWLTQTFSGQLPTPSHATPSTLFGLLVYCEPDFILPSSEISGSFVCLLRQIVFSRGRGSLPGYALHPASHIPYSMC